jgi:radical SAM protein with 4Fe4S-binding SPASM domain
MGVGEVALIGGEAYMRNDFILVIREIRKAGMMATMVTGGYGMTKDRAAAAVEAGIVSVSVSIDGLQESHDRVRNTPDSWDRAFRALQYLREAGSRVTVNSQINVWTRHELMDLLELIAAEGVHAWQIQITVPHGNAADHPEILLQPHMMLELFETIDKVLDRAADLGVKIYPGNSLGYFGPYEYKLRRHQMAKTGHYPGCQAGTSAIGIESNGLIKGCPSLGGETNIGGNWRDQGLEFLWSSTPQLTSIRQRTVDDLWGYCRECYYADICMGGCTAVSEPVLGRPGNNPFCHHRALEMDRQGLRERIEFVRKAPDIAFGTALFRVVREHKDPELRRRHGPVEIEEPRTSRLEEWMGPGRPLSKV